MMCVIWSVIRSAIWRLYEMPYGINQTSLRALFLFIYHFMMHIMFYYLRNFYFLLLKAFFLLFLLKAFFSPNV